MGSQIERIMFLTERGWHPYEGSVDISVYEQLKCPAPLFAKWLYEGKRCFGSCLRRMRTLLYS